MLAHAFLTVATATERTQGPAPTDTISLTCNEVQHLLAALVTIPINDLAASDSASQPGADDTNTEPEQAHYQRQATQEP